MFSFSFNYNFFKLFVHIIFYVQDYNFNLWHSQPKDSYENSLIIEIKLGIREISKL